LTSWAAVRFSKSSLVNL